MKLIPAIDLIGGQCVRLQQGDYSKKTIYASDPLEVAKSFEDAGIRHLHLVDLDGAQDGESKNLKVLEQLASQTGLEIDFGGGIRTLEAFRRVFDLGAAQATAGSLAVSSPEEVQQAVAAFGASRIILGADHNNGTIATHGWQKGSGVSLEAHIAFYLDLGMDQVVCTDIAKDGMLQGPSFKSYTEVLRQFPNLKLIASGGVSSMDDLYQLQQIGCHGAIIGKAIYEGAIDLKQLENYIIDQNVD